MDWGKTDNRGLWQCGNWFYTRAVRGIARYKLRYYLSKKNLLPHPGYDKKAEGSVALKNWRQIGSETGKRAWLCEREGYNLLQGPEALSTFTRKRKVQMCVPDLGRIPEDLRSVAMRERLYAEVDLTEASGQSQTRAIAICRIGVTKRHSLAHLQGQLFFPSVI